MGRYIRDTLLFLASLLVLVGGAVEASHLVVNLSDKVNHKLSLSTSSKFLINSHLEDMSLLIQLAFTSKLPMQE